MILIILNNLTMITSKTYKALKTVRDNPGIRAREFGEMLWPDADGHHRRSNGGHGAQRGKGMWLAAGSYLSRLQKAGFVRMFNTWGWKITKKGVEAIYGFEGVQVICVDYKEELPCDTHDDTGCPVFPRWSPGDVLMCHKCGYSIKFMDHE